jgi:hypothetical protein
LGSVSNDDASIQSVFAFKFDFLGISEFRQQIKTFRLKYVFLAGKIIRSARYGVMKLPAKYPYKDVYEKYPA